MILDKLEHAGWYETLNKNFKKGFDYLKNTDLLNAEIGKFEIDGKNVFAIISEYDSKKHEDCRLEAHRTYADIQFIIAGREAIGYTPLCNQEVTAEYIPEKDIIFFSGETTQLPLEAGMFAIFFPQDAHLPGRHTEKSTHVKKIVLKVSVSS